MTIPHKGGRPKSLPTILELCNRLLDESLPELFAKLIELAKEGDREALVYCLDRRLGRPKLEIDNRFSLEVSLNADALEKALRPILAEQRALIAQYLPQLPAGQTVSVWPDGSIVDSSVRVIAEQVDDEAIGLHNDVAK